MRSSGWRLPETEPLAGAVHVTSGGVVSGTVQRVELDEAVDVWVKPSGPFRVQTRVLPSKATLKAAFG